MGRRSIAGRAEPESTGGHSQPFRTCGACGARWDTWQAFLEDPRLSLVGLQAAERTREANLIVFEHACGSSVSVRTSRLRFLLPDPGESARHRPTLGLQECRSQCQQLEEWRTCDRSCLNEPARRVLQEILRVKEGQARRR